MHSLACGRFLALPLAALLSATAGWSTEEPERTPRIGVVLSGGGALGGAHVGVLQVLEELRVPIDFVAGTSMGAIVGGLYASGRSPEEMERILAETDWRDLFDDRPPRRELPYREKVDDQTFLARFEAGFNRGKFQLPPGLVTGQKLGLVLKRLTPRSIGVDDFDHLPIPFRCVATDLETGEMVVLERGDLALAMRASMSVPGFFSPVEVEDRLLVDGGVVRNLPVDVVRAMGADIVIAVDTGLPLLGRDELGSMVAVTKQVIGMDIRKNVEEQAADATVVIRPDLVGFRSTQFERSIEMVPLGEAAARLAADTLSEYSVSEDAFLDHLHRLRGSEIDPAEIVSVQATMSSAADPKLVMSRVRVEAGDQLDMEPIADDLQRLFRSGEFERVDALFIPADGGYVLNYEAHDKSWGPNYVRAGLNLFADLEGESSFNILTSYRMTRLNRLRGELKFQAQVGEDPIFTGEYYQPFSIDRTWFFAAGLEQATERTLLPTDQGLFAPYQVDLILGSAALGYQFGKYGELRVGLFRSRVEGDLREEAEVDPPPDVARSFDSDLGGILVSAVVDQLDNVNFPRHGILAVANYLVARETLGSDAEYDNLSVLTVAAASRGRHTLLGISNLYSALGSDAPATASLGGLFSLSGTPPDSIVGRYGGSLALLYLHRLFQLPATFGDGLYVGGSLEAGNLWDDSREVSFSDLRYAASVVVGADTVLGPLYLAQGYSEGGDKSFYFFIGRTF